MTVARRFTLTNVLIGINVAAFLWQVVSGGAPLTAVVWDGWSNKTLFLQGAILGVACTQYGEWWRILTGAFLHGNVVHIAMNMIALMVLGADVELLFGKVRFAVIYAFSLLVSGLAVVYAAPTDVTVGASGAIFGLFGAVLAVSVRLGRRGRAALGRIVPVLIVNLALTFSVPSISKAGHIGGLVAGFAIGVILFALPATQRRVAALFGSEPAGPTAVETIERPPEAAPHEDASAPALEMRDPRE